MKRAKSACVLCFFVVVLIMISHRQNVDEPYNIYYKRYKDGVGGNKEIAYPQIDGLRDEELETKINATLYEAAISTAEFQNEHFEEDIEFEIWRADNDIISVVYSGFVMHDIIAYPYLKGYAVTINVHNGNKMCLEDFVNLDELYQHYKDGKYVDANGLGDDTVLGMVIENYMEEGVHETDYYVTENGIGILIEGAKNFLMYEILNEPVMEMQKSSSITLENLEQQFDNEAIQNISNKYEKWYEVNYETMAYIDEAGFEYVKKLYNDIDYKGNLSNIDIDEYKVYIEKYKKALLDSLPIYDANTGAEIKFSDYQYEETCGILKKMELHDIYKYSYELVDIDVEQDGIPELCIFAEDFLDGMKLEKECKWILQYDEEYDRVCLYSKTYSEYDRICGSQKFIWSNGDSELGFYQLNDEGEIEFEVTFRKVVNDETIVYLVSLPINGDCGWINEIPTEIEPQLYFIYDRYYCRIAQNQFEEFTGEVLEQWELAEAFYKNNTYTFEEMFSEN